MLFAVLNWLIPIDDNLKSRKVLFKLINPVVDQWWNSVDCLSGLSPCKIAFLAWTIKVVHPVSAIRDTNAFNKS